MAETTDFKKRIADLAPRRKENIDLSSVMFGKLPPQAIDLEQAVLGALMIERDAVTNVIDILEPASFYLDSHKHIYQAVRNLFDHSKPVDILSVTEELKSMGKLEDVDGQMYLAELTNRVASAAHVEHHARIISQKYIQRELISLSTTIIKDAYEDTVDVLELLNKAEEKLFQITDQNLRTGHEDMSKLMTQAIKELELLKDQEDSLTGVPTGFSNLDRLTAGWQKSDLIVLAARPGMGKTAFVLSIARNAAVDYGKKVAIFSLEMSNIQLVNRLISAEVELEADKFRRGNLEGHEWQQLTSRSDKLAEAKIIIDDSAAINAFELRAKCRRLYQVYDGIDLFILDYLQLMSGTRDNKSGNREQEISNISRAIKSIAKELKVPFIALSQLSRAVETRGGFKKPQLSDLRESGAIEQDADLVCFLYRGEYYGFDVDEKNNPTKGMGEIIIAKHRNGALASVPMRFIAKFAKFTDYDEGLLPNGGYQAIDSGEDQSITLKSKMDEEEDDSPFF